MNAQALDPVAAEAEIFGRCWEYKVGTNVGVGLAADAVGVYFLDSENRLNGVDLERGNKVWSSDLGGEVISNLHVVQDTIFLVTNSQPEAPGQTGRTIARAVSRQTGITSWRAEIAPSSIVWLGSVAANIVFVGSNGSVTSLSAVEGKLIWKTDVRNAISAPPSFSSNGIELGTATKEVLRISPTGDYRVIWKSTFLPSAILTDSSGRLLVGDERGNLTSVSADGSKSWRFRNGAQISSVSQYDSEYLATSHDNFVYKISRYGDVKWKRRLSGRVGDGPILLGDSAVVSTVGTGSVYVIDLKNGKISNRIETGDESSIRLASTMTESFGFIVGAPTGISYFSTKCPSK